MAKKYTGPTTVRALMEIIKGELAAQKLDIDQVLSAAIKKEDIVKDLAAYVTPEGGDDKVVAAAVVKELQDIVNALITPGEGDNGKDGVVVKFGDVLKTWEGYDVDADADKIVAASLVKAIKDQVDTLAQTVSDELDGKKGQPGGIASLDETGKVPADQLPSYVDDVVEGFLVETTEGESVTRKFYEPNEDETAASATEIVGEKGKIYVDLSTNFSYRWSGSTYVRVNEIDLVELTAADVEAIWNEVAAANSTPEA